MVQNKTIIYNHVPSGLPVPGKDLTVETHEFDLEQAPPAGGITTKNFYASFDPYQRGRMREASAKSYAPPYPLGKPVISATIARVLKSDNPGLKAGDLMQGIIANAEYAAVPKALADQCKKIENPYNLDPINFMGPLGMPGLTAYSSLYEIGKPVKGETIFISAASGAVGQLVGQLAKRQGLRVIGSVGSSEKLEFIVKELKFDAGFNYKEEKASDALARLAPEGIDVYYENVGGEQLEAALNALNDFGRIVACGMVSDYNKPQSEKYAIRNLFTVISKRLVIRGFIVNDPNMGPAYEKEWVENVSKWLHDGSIKAKLSITDGIQNGPEGFVGMLQGKNFGKAVLKIADIQ